MDRALELPESHGVLIVAAWVFADQVGVPIPTVPLVLAVGALAGLGKLSFGWALLAAIGGSLVADLLWYSVGRRFGSRVFGLAGRISPEPDPCVHRARELFVAHRMQALILGKFLPEVNAAVAALAGSAGIRTVEFLAYDITSALFWARAWMGLGYVLRDGVSVVAGGLTWLGAWISVLLAVALGGYLVVKHVQRRRSCDGGSRIPIETDAIIDEP